MLKILICARGHRWGYVGSAHSPTSGATPSCPVCGALPEPLSAGTATKVVENASVPTLRHFPPSSASETPAGPAAPSSGERSTPPLPTADRPGVEGLPTREFANDAGKMLAPPGPPVVADYQILRELGRGGMGIVYQARQKSLGRLVALKMILAGSHARAEDRARFYAEAQAIAKLQHPNIVRIYEIGEADGHPFFSLEYVDGGSLAQRLTGTPLPPRQAARLVAAVSSAIEAAHGQGLVHRDLKPANILLQHARNAGTNTPASTPRGKPGEPSSASFSSSMCLAGEFVIPKITDFGLAKQIEGSAAQTRSGAILGTPCYMAPEQATGRGAAIQPTTDVYALGAILYELLTGRPPFQGETPLDTLQQVQADDPVPPRCLQPKVPVDLETICVKCLQKEPNHRYGTAAQLAEDLDRFLAGHPIAARPVPWWERLGKWARRKPALVASLAVTVAALLVLLVGGVWHAVSLERALTTADELRLAAQEERDQTLKQQRLVREYVYGADVKLAQALWINKDVRQSVELLAKYVPEPGTDDLREFTWHYLWRLCHGERRRLGSHAKDVYYVAFSPNGKLLATAGHDGLVYLFDVATGKERALLSGHRDEVNTVAFSPDGRELITASDDGAVKTWDVETSVPVATLEVSANGVISVAISPDGTLLTTGDHDGYVRFWDRATGKPLAAHKAHLDVVESLAFAPDGRTLASCGKRGRAILWDVAQRRERTTLCDDPSTQCRHLAFAPDGKTIGIAFADGTMKLWTAGTAELLHTCRGHTDCVQAVAFAPDSRTAATGSDDGTIKLWDVASGGQLHSIQGHTQRVWTVAFSPDGRTLASGSRDCTVRLWDLPPRDATESLPREGPWPTTLASLDARNLLVAGADGSVQCWNLETRQLQAQVLDKVERKDGARLAFDQSGKWIARSFGDRVQVWKVTAGGLRFAIPKVRPGSAVAVSPDGQFLAVQAPDLAIHVWDTSSGARRYFTGQVKSLMSSVVFSPDGRTLATGHQDHSIAMWNVSSGSSRVVFLGHRGEVSCLAFAPDGRTLASGDRDRSAKLWDVLSGQERGNLLGHEKSLTAVAFSPDGRTLATGSEDKGVKLWSVRTGLQLADLDGHDGPVRDVVFAADGRTLVSASVGPGRKSQVLLWPSASDSDR